MNYPPGSVRKRIPFKFPREDGSEEPHILDEQEQEELVNTLRTDTSYSHSLYLSGIRVVVGLSCVLHLISLSNTTVPPTAAVFPPSTFEASPIPFALLLTWLHILIHLYLVVKSLPNQVPVLQRLQSSPRLNFYCAIASSVAPTLSLLLLRGWANLMWWSLTGLMVGLDFLIRTWIRQDDESLSELEKLKYDAKGA